MKRGKGRKGGKGKGENGVVGIEKGGREIGGWGGEEESVVYL